MNIRRTRLEDHFPSGELFEETLAAAVHVAKDEDLPKTMRGLVDLHSRWELYGMRMNFSAADCASLCRVAGIVPPGENCHEHG